MSITEEQIMLISSSIIISDVIDYINKHQEDYEEFIKKTEEGNDVYE